MQKFKIPLIAAGSLLTAVALYFLLLRSGGLYDAVPASAVAVIEVNDWALFTSKLNTTVAGNSLKQTYAAQKLLAELKTMEELLAADKSLKAAITSRKTIAALQLTSATDFDFLFVTELAGVNDNTLLNHIQASPKVKTTSVHLFKNQKIVDIQLRDGRQLSFGKRGDILAFSFTTFLAENAIAALQTGDNLAGEKSFKAIKKSISLKADVNLYFNYQKAAVIFPVSIRPAKLALLADIKSTGAWAHLDVTMANDKLELDGDVWTPNDEPATQKNIFDGALLSKLPAHVAYVNLSRADTGGSPTLARYFESWIGDAKLFAILEPLKEDFAEQNIFAISLKNKAKALNDLKGLIIASGGQAIPIDTFLNNEIYNLQEGSAINQLFGNSLVTFNNTYFTVLDDAAVFANRADVLKLLLEKAVNGETIDKDKNFIATGFSQFGKNTSLQYVNIQRSDLLLRSLLQDNSTATPLFNTFSNIFTVSNATDHKLSLRVVLSAGGESKSQHGLLWKATLKRPSTFTPSILTNITTGENEVFTQDTANNIYLLNQSGGIVFSKNIGEPILGKIYQIDYYNNGKLQYIFNSAQHVFIVDRLGYDVASYPLRLSATAVAGLVVPHTTGALRYYVPCANGSIYGYEANGKPLSGFSPKAGVGIVSAPLQCLTYKRNDYILVFNTAGRLMLLDARGNQKWSIENLPTGQSPSLVMGGNDFKVLSATGTQLIEISAEGNDNTKVLMDSANTFCAVMTSDTSYTYYFTTGSQVRAYSEDDEFMGAANIAGAALSSMEVINNGPDKYLLLRDQARGSLFIYDTKLKPVADFTYSTSNAVAVTDLFNRGQWIGISADKGNSVSAYRIK